MRPALSVVFLTTLIGAGQGLFVAIFAADAASQFGQLTVPPGPFVAVCCAVAVVLCTLGLFASFFHLGRPERAWRTAAMWRTSWLSREVIALPLFMALAATYGWASYKGWSGALAIGALAFAACAALFYCTSMIYACIKFLQEWASPFTTPNFVLMGCASGFVLAAALSTRALERFFGITAFVLTAAALVTRLASIARNRRIRHKSTVQSATGLHHPNVRQVSQGFTARSFNNEEFFHGQGEAFMKSAVVAFVVFAFVGPMLMIARALQVSDPSLFFAAFLMQYAGLLLERWHFLADSHHPQNLYYQRVA